MDVAKILAELTQVERDILTIYAIGFTPLTNDQSAEMVSAANIKTKEGKKVTRQIFNEARKSLIDKEILAQPSAFGYYMHSALVQNPIVRETVMYEAAQSSNLKNLAATVQDYFNRNAYYYGENVLSKSMRNARIAIYIGDFNTLPKIESEALQSYYDYDITSFTNIYAIIFSAPFRPAWFDTIPKELKHRVLPRMAEISILNGVDTKILEQYIEEKHVAFGESAWLMQLFRGDLSKVLQLKAEDPESVSQHLLGVLAAMQGNYNIAVLHFEEYAKQWRRSVNKKRAYHRCFPTCFIRWHYWVKKMVRPLKKRWNLANRRQKIHLNSKLPFITSVRVGITS